MALRDAGASRRRGPRGAAGPTLAAILAATVLLRWRLLAVPLERDEGEYAYMAQLILSGEMPYLAAHNMKLPGVYYAYAAILGVLGETDVAVHLGLLAINLAAVVLLYRLGRTLLDAATGLAAAAAYAVLSLSASVAGFSANAEHFVVIPMLASALVLARGAGLGRTARPLVLAAAGVLAGVAVLMKQHGAAFVLFGVLVLLAERPAREWRAAATGALIFAGAALLPFGLTALAMAGAGAFGPFWFWTVVYAREYAAIVPLDAGLRGLLEAVRDIAGSAVALWVLVAVGASALWWDPEARRRAGFVALWAGCSALAVALGLRFSDHYFIMLLPAAALLVGIAASAVARVLAVRLPARAEALAAAVVGLAVASALAQERAYLFRLSPAEVSRAVNGTNPFPESVAIGDYLRRHAAPDDLVGVIGSEPQIYFYARRRAATTYLYTYPLMEPHPFARRMQEEMTAQLARAAPRFLVLVNVPTSWSRRPGSGTLLLDWAERTVREAYEPVGLAEIVPGAPTRYRWGAAARTAEPESPFYGATFRRRS
jgi:hypothetical protein